MSDDGYILIAVPEDLAQRLEQATGEIPYLLGHAARTFEWLHLAHASGHLDTDNGWPHMIELCARGMNAAVQKEAEAIIDFDKLLRRELMAQARKDLGRVS